MGDGFASLIGTKFGKRKYTIFRDVKSLEGSISMFIVEILVSLIALCYYGVEINIFVLVVVSFIATLVEGMTLKGLDNLTVSLIYPPLLYSFVRCVHSCWL